MNINAGKFNCLKFTVLCYMIHPRSNLLKKDQVRMLFWGPININKIDKLDPPLILGNFEYNRFFNSKYFVGL